MATSLITSLDPLLFSSNIPDLEFSTDLYSFNISIYAGQVRIFTTLQYSYNNSIKFFDLKSIIEDYMIEKNLSYGYFSVLANNLDGSQIYCSKDFNVIYSAVKIDISASDFIKNSYLSTLSSKTITKNSIEYISCILEVGEELIKKFHIVYESENGTKSYEYSITSSELSSLFQSFTISYTEILNEVQKYDSSAKFILSYSVEVGKRGIVFYIVDSLPGLTLLFRNNFNCYEMVQLECITIEKLKVDKSLASINDRYSFYDKTISKEYEVTTSFLPYDFALWIQQLIFSQEVKIYSNATEMKRILITDSTCEISNSNSDMNRIKFTYRFTDKASPLSIEYSSASRIFTQEYDNQFS